VIKIRVHFAAALQSDAFELCSSPRSAARPLGSEPTGWRASERERETYTEQLFRRIEPLCHREGAKHSLRTNSADAPQSAPRRTGRRGANHSSLAGLAPAALLRLIFALSRKLRASALDASSQGGGWLAGRQAAAAAAVNPAATSTIPIVFHSPARPPSLPAASIFHCRAQVWLSLCPPALAAVRQPNCQQAH